MNDKKIEKKNKAKRKCARCSGFGVIQAVGLWVTQYDTQKCPRCNGTGKERLTISNQFEESGQHTVL